MAPTTLQPPALTPSDQRFLHWFKLLLSVGAPPGYEQAMAQIVAKELTAMGYAYEHDPSGNLLVRLPATKSDASTSCVMLAAHLDEIAVIVKAIDPDGRVSLAASGGMLPFKTGERPLILLGDRKSVAGVLSMGSGHQMKTAGAAGVMEWAHCHLFTGLSARQLAEAGVRPGTPAVLSPADRGPLIFGTDEQPLVGAWTLDDRAGVAVLLEWLLQYSENRVSLAHPTVVAFTVHEEGGCLGAAALAARLRPDIFIAIDGAPWKPGDGYSVTDEPVCWSKDQLANYDRRLLGHFREAAELAGSRLQHAVIETGYSDASSVYKIGASPRVGLLGHARYNSHGFEVAALRVFPTLVNTLSQLLQRHLD